MRVLYYLVILFVHIVLFSIPFLYLNYFLKSLVESELLFKAILTCVLAGIILVSHRISRRIVCNQVPWFESFKASFKFRK
jgi:hypothetical protein